MVFLKPFAFTGPITGYEQDPLSHPAASDEQIDWSPVGLVVVASAIALALGQSAP